MRSLNFYPIVGAIVATCFNSTSAADSDLAVDGVDQLNFDAHYIQYFKKLGIGTASDLSGTSRFGTEDLDLDYQYTRYFRELSVETPETDKSPAGPEPRRNTESSDASKSAAIPAAPTELWTQLQQGFRLPELESPLVDSYEKWFARHPSYITRVFTRGQNYLPYIISEIESRSLPMEVALLPVIESAFNPFAVSHAKAVGMWQFIAGTARHYGVRMDFWYEGRRDLIDSTRAALDYLQYLESDMNGNWFHAFAAYNGGENRIQREIKRNRRKGKSTDFINLKLHKETRHYVPRLIALRNVVRNPEKFGIELPQFENRTKFRSIALDYPIDLGIAAELAGLSLNEFRKLNPGYRRRTTGSKGGSRLLLPEAEAEQLLTALESRTAKSLIAAAGYRVRSGDTLSQIARRNQLSIKEIRTANRLKGDFLKIGQVLTLPLHSQNYAVLGQDGIDIYHKKSSAKRAEKDRITHRVKRGDTLSAIARRYSVYVRQITGWNSMRATDVIHSGQQLVIFK